MKKLALILVLAAAVFIVSDAGATGHLPICQPDGNGKLENCDGASVLIFPWRFGEGAEVGFRTDQEIILGPQSRTRRGRF